MVIFLKKRKKIEAAFGLIKAKRHVSLAEMEKVTQRKLVSDRAFINLLKGEKNENK